MELQDPESSNLLIDLSGIESVPFPQQLITAEMDDTFGLFGPAKSRSHSAPTTTWSDQSSRPAPDVFSPVMDPPGKHSLEDDSVFLESIAASGTPVSSKSDRTPSSNAESLSAGMTGLGLNDAFVRSANSSIATATTFNESRGSAHTTLISSISSITYDRVSSIVSSSGGGISGVTAEDFRLADLDDTSESTVPLMKRTPQVDSDPSDIISQVLDRRKSLSKKPVDDDIARKIQEMFDAASPTKNPEFYNTRSFRHSLTPARQMSTHREPFSYATPRRVPVPSLNSSAGSSITPIPMADGHNLHLVETTYPDKTKQHEMDVVNNSLQSNSKHSILKDKNQDNPEHFGTPKRLSFSTSSSSEADPDSAKSQAKLINFEAKSFVKPVGYSLPRLRQSNNSAKSGPQPLKAVHLAVPKASGNNNESLDDKMIKRYGTTSAPVRRKFAPPKAASSPIATPPRNKPKEVKSSGYGRTSVVSTAITQAPASNHGIFKLPSPGRSLKPSGDVLVANRRNSTGLVVQRRSFSARTQTQIQVQLPPPSTSRRSLMKENVNVPLPRR